MSRQRPTAVSQRARKWWKRFYFKFFTMPAKQEYVTEVFARIGAARAKHAVGSCCGNAVGQGMRELGPGDPLRVRFWQNENGIMPDLRSAFPGHRAGKVCAARHDQCAAADARKRRGEANWIGKRREMFPFRILKPIEAKARKRDF